MQEIKPIERAPTLHLRHGKAWRWDLPAMRKRMNMHTDAGIDAWLVEAAWAHPAWHSYVITLIHLRALPGFPPPLIHLSDATHEVLVQALVPEGDRDRLLEEGLGHHCLPLVPSNFAAQIIEITDDLACDRVRRAVEMICQGSLSPDTDFHQQWVALFGDNMMRERA